MGAVWEKGDISTEKGKKLFNMSGKFQVSHGLSLKPLGKPLSDTTAKPVRQAAEDSLLGYSARTQQGLASFE